MDLFESSEILALAQKLRVTPFFALQKMGIHGVAGLYL